MLSPVTLPGSVLTSRLVSQSEPAVQRPCLKRGDIEHNEGVSLRWRRGSVETLRNSDSDENETFRLSRAAWVRSVLLACPQSP